jgi:hypothetical protein
MGQAPFATDAASRTASFVSKKIAAFGSSYADRVHPFLTDKRDLKELPKSCAPLKPLTLTAS